MTAPAVSNPTRRRHCRLHPNVRVMRSDPQSYTLPLHAVPIPMTESTPSSTRQDPPELPNLLARVALGDRAAFARLYDQVKSPLFGVILRIHGDRAQAEETLQEVFVNIWRRASTYDADRSQPMAWLVSVARYKAIDSVRLRTLATVSTTVGEGDSDWMETIPSDSLGPAEAHQLADDKRQLMRCMATLTSEQRQALSLAYYQGYSHTEVAQHLSQPLGSVKSWVRRGLLALQRCMAGSFSGAGH